jgi:EamA domain-containing membrane protein RarD
VGNTVLLALTGVVAAPLLAFSGADQVPLSMMGLLQYLRGAAVRDRRSDLPLPMPPLL